MSFGSFLKKAFNPLTPMLAARNINRNIKNQGIGGLLNPMSATVQGLKDTANSTNDPNPISVGRDVVTGLGQQGIKGMLNPLSSLRGIQLANRSFMGGGGSQAAAAVPGAMQALQTAQSGVRGGATPRSQPGEIASMLGNAFGPPTNTSGAGPSRTFGYAGGAPTNPSGPAPMQGLDSNAIRKLRQQGVQAPAEGWGSALGQGNTWR